MSIILFAGLPILRASSTLLAFDSAIQPCRADPSVPERPDQQQQLPPGHDRDDRLRSGGHHQPSLAVSFVASECKKLKNILNGF